MIIDAILDRKEGVPYTREDLKYMYDCAMDLENYVLAQAIDSGTNKDIQIELCRYIDSEGYNSKIKDYIKSVNWLEYDNGRYQHHKLV